MAENQAAQRLKKDKAEKDYDACVTKLNRCQDQLSNKAAQAQKLPMDEYRKWLANKKLEQAQFQMELQVLKQKRAEARRQFNSWQPAHMEEWRAWPDCGGWWWNCTDGNMEIHPFEYREHLDMFSFDTGDQRRDVELIDCPWAPCWKFQEEPEKP